MTTSHHSFDPLRSGRAGNYVLGDSKRRSATNGTNNDSGSDLGDEELDCNDNDSKPSRKPSYLGLSCAVSGYSNYARYRSPLRKTSSPTQIHVGSEPQTLDAGRSNQVVVGMRNGHKSSSAIRGQQMITDNRFFSSKKLFSTPGAAGDSHSNNSAREGSPGSDCSGSSSIGSSGSGGGGGGSLVQKQIERLYGGRVVPVRLMSPEDLSFEKEPSTGGSGSNPLDFKSLKAPAVFRLLRPEFREQLKNNSCQVFIPTDHSSIGTLSTPVASSCYQLTTSNYEQRREKKNLPILQRFQNNPSSDRVIPVKMSCERVIPIVAEKPNLPAKPSGSKEKASSPTHVFTSPTLVANCMKATTSQRVVEKGIPPVAHEEVTEELDEGDFSQPHPVGGGGTRERSFLCPIQEEESDSTASTNSLNIGNRCNGVSKRMSSSKSNGKGYGPVAAAAVPAGQVQDGNYFIKVLENEIFKFEEQICDFEEDLSTPDSNIPEDVRDSILAAVGKARLLISQKLVQFRGLCDKNINSNHAEDPFVPTCDDLAGFWDMVYIQIEHVHSLFAELVTLRKNGWVQSKKVLSGSSVNGLSEAKSSCSKKRVVKTSKANSEAQNKQKSEATKARDEARKKMLEERRKLMKKRNAASNEGVELFVAVK